MLIEFTDQDAERRDSLKEKYKVIAPETWKAAESFEDAVDLFEKYERDPDEISDFNQYWDFKDTDEDFDEFNEDEYEFEDDDDLDEGGY